MGKLTAIILLLFSFCANAQRIPLGKDSKQAAYKPKLNLKPGDTLVLSGHYKLIYLDSIFGTKEKPIVITNADSVTILGYASYCFVITGKYFKILGNGDPSIKYGIKISGFDSTYSLSAVGLTNSSNYEIANLEIFHTAGGFLQNPVLTEDVENNYIHDCYIHDLDNPKSLGRSEGFYIGNTHTVGAGRFRNFRIENNLLENLSGDGIQVCQGDFTIKNNVVRNWGKAQLTWQRNGILVGELTTSIVEGNVLDGGHGVAFENFGGGYHRFVNNKISNVDVSTLQNEDIVYVQGRSKNFLLDFATNTFTNCKPNRKIIYNNTADSMTLGSMFCANSGVDFLQTTLNKKDKWGCTALPIDDTPPVRPEPQRPHKKYNVVIVSDILGRRLLVEENYELEKAKEFVRDSKLPMSVYVIKYSDGQNFYVEKVAKLNK